MTLWTIPACETSSTFDLRPGGPAPPVLCFILVLKHQEDAGDNPHDPPPPRAFKMDAPKVAQSTVSTDSRFPGNDLAPSKKNPKLNRSTGQRGAALIPSGFAPEK